MAGIYILLNIRNYANLRIQNGKTLPKLNIGIYSKFGQYYRYDISMYDFIHTIQLLIPIWSWISKMMLENVTFFHFSFEMLLRLHYYLTEGLYVDGPKLNQPKWNFQLFLAYMGQILAISISLFCTRGILGEYILGEYLRKYGN